MRIDWPFAKENPLSIIHLSFHFQRQIDFPHYDRIGILVIEIQFSYILIRFSFDFLSFLYYGCKC
jgi:hypothetical protein